MFFHKIMHVYLIKVHCCFISKSVPTIQPIAYNTYLTSAFLIALQLLCLSVVTIGVEWTRPSILHTSELPRSANVSAYVVLIDKLSLSLSTEPSGCLWDVFICGPGGKTSGFSPHHTNTCRYWSYWKSTCHMRVCNRRMTVFPPLA